MENEIKVNEYVRMIDGLIAKIVTKDKDDHFILDRYYAGGRHLTEIEVKNDIVKHSPNLIDIIEVGDYVNGHLVVDKYIDIDDYGKDFVVLEVESDLMLHKSLHEKHIRTVATKEQMESKSYKVIQEEN